VRPLIIFIVCGLITAYAQEKRPLKEEVEALLKQLGSDDWLKRQEAGKRLVEMGVEAGDLLWEHLKKVKDVEVRAQIEKILKEMGYVPQRFRAQLEELFATLKSSDVFEVEAAFRRLVSLAAASEEKKRWIKRFAEKFFDEPAGRNVEAELQLSSRIVREGLMPKIKLTLKNKDTKPAWIPLIYQLELRVDIGARSLSRYFYLGVAVGDRVVLRTWSRSNFGMLLLPPGNSIQLSMLPVSSGGSSSSIMGRNRKFEFGQEIECQLVLRSPKVTGGQNISPFRLPEGVYINKAERVVILPSPRAYYGVTLGFECSPQCRAGGKIKVRYRVTRQSNRISASILDRYAKSKVVVVATDGKKVFVLGEMKPQRNDNEVVAEAELPAPKKEGKYMVWAISPSSSAETTEQILHVLPPKEQKETKEK